MDEATMTLEMEFSDKEEEEEEVSELLQFFFWEHKSISREKLKIVHLP